ncbi:hypothetical protein [Phormidesmis sp. 146-33]
MKHLLVAMAFFLVACEPNEMYPVPVGGGVSGSGSVGSYSAPQSAPKTAPQQVPVKPLPIASPSPIQETHGVVSRQNCYDMEAKFKRQGRRVTLKRVEQSTNPGAVLQYICIFEGEDAEQGYFEEKRY